MEHISILKKALVQVGLFVAVMCNVHAQVPELMYFQFNTSSSSSVTNDAQTLTRVSTAGTLTALTVGSGGQFGNGLIGNGGVSSSNNFNSGWSLNLSGPWTISMWFSGVTNALTSNYMFGDASSSTFRALTGSGVVAGAGNLEIRATGMTDVFLYNVFDAIGTPVVVHFVYDPTIPAIKGYINGVLSTTVAQSASMVLTGGSGFLIGGYGSNNCLPNGGKMDEFRMYNRALSATEIAATWNVDLLASTCAAPTGLASSGVTSSGGTVTWNAVSGSIGYEYVFDQVSANPSGSGTLTTLTSYSASGLNPSTTYYLHVRNKCSSSSFSSWVTTSFTTSSAPVTCNAPATVTATNITASSLTLNWNTVSGSQGYEYKVDQVATGPASGWQTTTSGSAGITGLTGGTGYYAHVRNICSPTNKSSWVNYPFTTQTCNKPTNVLMSNITDSSADVLWSLMPNAGGYDYAVDFSNLDPVSGIKNTSTITTHLTGLFPNSKYYVHVRSRCFAVDSSAWRLDSFITTMTCYAPAIQVNYLGTNEPYAFWAPIPTAIAYEYALNNYSSPDPAFGKEIYNTFIDLTLPDDGKDYYLHVRAKCNSQFTTSKWSTVALRTGTTGVSLVSSNETISIYPNPVKDVLFVTGADDMPYRITDIAGRILLSGRINERTGINTTSLSTGLYLLLVNNNNAEQQFRFIK